MALATTEPGVSKSETPGRVRPSLVRVLLWCGVAYAVSYVVANDVVAATWYRGYSRISQAVSELSATHAPTRPFLVGMLPVWTVLMLAFGIGVLRSANGRRAIATTGWLLIASGIVGILWLPFPMTSRAQMVVGSTNSNDVGHIVLTAATVLLILAMLGSAAVAYHARFRIYAAITAVVVFVFGALTGAQAANIADGRPTPTMGLFERISIGGWLLFLVVLAATLLREERTRVTRTSPSRSRSSRPPS